DGVTGMMALEVLSERLQSAVPGIVITADRTEEVAEEIRRSGYYLLQKPVRPAALRALLTRMLQANRAPGGWPIHPHNKKPMPQGMGFLHEAASESSRLHFRWLHLKLLRRNDRLGTRVHAQFA